MKKEGDARARGVSHLTLGIHAGPIELAIVVHIARKPFPLQWPGHVASSHENRNGQEDGVAQVRHLKRIVQKQLVKRIVRSQPNPHIVDATQERIVRIRRRCSSLFAEGGEEGLRQVNKLRLRQRCPLMYLHLRSVWWTAYFMLILQLPTIRQGL